MKVFLFIGLIVLTVVTAVPRSHRAAYELPANAKQLVGDIRTTFVCTNDGYYADQDNFCQIFHVCHTFILPDGTFEMIQWSFLCGNNTIFNQFSLTCSYSEDAVPCESAEDFWYLNANIGVNPNVPFHNTQDVAKANFVIQGLEGHPLKPERIVQSTRRSIPSAAVRQSYTKTPAPRQHTRPAVWPPTDRVPLPQPPIRQRIGLTPPRPNMHPMTVPPSPLLLSPITVTRAQKPRYFHVQKPRPAPRPPAPAHLIPRFEPTSISRPAQPRKPIPQYADIHPYVWEPPKTYVNPIMSNELPRSLDVSLLEFGRPPIPQYVDIQ